jgi:hypothetical protein
MAERRMFAKTIVVSDTFLDMPSSARCLYFTLGMFADDDGFINNPKGIMRQCGASQDDLGILLAKNFLLAFASGVVVIRDWRVNNYLRGDRKIPTKFQEELSELSIDENGSYYFGTDKTTTEENSLVGNCPSSDRQVTGTGKDSIGKYSIVEDSVDIKEKENNKLFSSKKGGKKKTKTDDVYFPEDSKLNQTFKDFLENRKTLKKPATDKAVELAIKRVRKFCTTPTGNLDIELAIYTIEKSIEYGWTGIFEPTDDSRKIIKPKDKPSTEVTEEPQEEIMDLWGDDEK